MVGDEESTSETKKKAVEVEDDYNEPDAKSKSPSLTSLDIAPEKPKTPETDV